MSLVEPITQVLAQVQQIGHPRSRPMLAILNGCYGAIKHLDGDIFKLGNTQGQMVSKKTALDMLDRFTAGENKVFKA